MKTRLQRNCLVLSAVLYAIVIYFLCLLCSCAGWKPDPWTKADTAREAGVLALLLVDYGQTADISDSPEFYERNPVLGKYPSVQQVRWYFFGCAVGHAGIALILPRSFGVGDIEIPIRELWQYTWIGIEGVTTIGNASLGIGWQW